MLSHSVTNDRKSIRPAFQLAINDPDYPPSPTRRSDGLEFLSSTNQRVGRLIKPSVVHTRDELESSLRAVSGAAERRLPAVENGSLQSRRARLRSRRTLLHGLSRWIDLASGASLSDACTEPSGRFTRDDETRIVNLSD